MLKTDHLKTLHDWLTYAVRLYEEKKIALGQVATVAHDEALYLLLHTLGLPLDSRPEVLKKKLSSVESAKAAQVLKRRIEDRVPAAYLTNEAFLGEYRFYVDERVIIPRSYFLEIIPQQLSHWLPNGLVGVKRAVDVCTGSGCLAILLAHNCLKAKVDAIELSPDAMTVAARNIREHRMEKRVKLYRSDCFDEVPLDRYDLIISNPPYEPTALMKTLPPEFKKEPRMALDGGTDGMDIIKKIIGQAGARLNPKGVLLLEIGALHSAVETEYGHLDPVWLPTDDASNSICLFQAEQLIAETKRTGSGAKPSNRIRK